MISLFHGSFTEKKMKIDIEQIRVKVSDLIESVEGVIRNEIDDERNPQAYVRRVIVTYSGIAAAINVTPIPFSSFVLLTPVHVAMVLHVGKRMGHELSIEKAGDVFKQIIGAVGLSVAARMATNALLKIGLPIVGGYLRSPAVFAMTYGLGRVAEEYFERRNEELDLDAKIAKEVFMEAVREGRVEGAYAEQAKSKTREKKAKAKKGKKPATKKSAKK